jgi:tetratricopeptide (TPR) repeat protein
MTKSVCFVIMPFGKKPDAAGRQIDFDAVYEKIIAPAIAEVGFNGVRADKEMSAGMIHKAMFERLILSEYAIADLTILNANVYYELGVRHAARPQTTVLMSAEASRLPFDVGPLSAMPYALDRAGKPSKAAADRAALVEKLAYCKNHDAPDSPLFTLLDGFTAPQVDHEKTDIFRREINRAQELKEKLHAAKANDVAALDALRDELGDIGAREAGVVIDLFLAYRSVKAWDRMIALYKMMDPVLANTALAREQYAFALGRAGRGAEAERVLEELIAKRGPSSETYGLLGRVHKDRWREAKSKGDALAARGFLKKAIGAYGKGFEADWRDAFPGVNTASLMEILAPGDPEVKALVPVVRYAAERKIARGAGDYWDHATLLELAVLERDDQRVDDALADTLAEKGRIDGWSPESTADNLRDIAAARADKGEAVGHLEAIIKALAPGKV